MLTLWKELTTLISDLAPFSARPFVIAPAVKLSSRFVHRVAHVNIIDLCVTLLLTKVSYTCSVIKKYAKIICTGKLII